MDFLPPLNLDGFYAHKKPWHAGLWFLVPSQLTDLNVLMHKINTCLNNAPSVAHLSLYHRFSSAYFWQSITTHENYAETKALWENTHLLMFANSETLVWLIDYAFPLLEEYLNCSLEECQRLNTQAKNRYWHKQLPGFEGYLKGINHINTQVKTLKSNLDTLKNQWIAITQLKLEHSADILKYLAQKLEIPCDFEASENLNANTLFFLKQVHPNPKLNLPHKHIDKNPPLICPVESTKNWEELCSRLRKLKIRHRLNAPKIPSAIPTSRFAFLSQFSLPSAYQAKLYFFNKGLKFAGLPILALLFLNGLLPLTGLAVGVGAWITYPYLKLIPNLFIAQWRRLEDFLQSYSDAYYRDFLIEKTDYIETIERSALWRKNRLAPGCHHVASFDPDLILQTYTDFNALLEKKMVGLAAMRPYFWQFWRQENRALIDKLIFECKQEQETLVIQMQLYAKNTATHLSKTLFFRLSDSQAPDFHLEKVSNFVARFAPENLPDLNLENHAIRFFLSCLIQSPDSPLRLKQPLVTQVQGFFATHCCDSKAIDQLLIFVRPYIENQKKSQAIIALCALLKQERIISAEQLDNYLSQIALSDYAPELVQKAIQDYLFATFTGHNKDIKVFFTGEQHRKLSGWLFKNQNLITEAEQYFNQILTLPSEQDWGVLPEGFFISPNTLKPYLSILELKGNHDIRKQLQEKIMALAPNYTGAPSGIITWLSVLWQEKCPITLEEQVIEARFSWMLTQVSTTNNLTPLDDIIQGFIEDVAQVMPRADNNHRLSRALANQPIFYMPWHAHTQKALEKLEETGLLLPSAKAAYSQKALRQWLLK